MTGPLAEEAPAPGPGTSFAPDGRALVPVAQVETLLAPLAASVEEWRRLAEEYRGRLETREARIAVLEQRGAPCLDSYIDHQAGRLKTRGTGQQRDAGKVATSTVAVATPACNPLSGLGQVAIREVSARAVCASRADGFSCGCARAILREMPADPGASSGFGSSSAERVCAVICLRATAPARRLSA